MKITELFNIIASTPNSNDKKELLKNNLNETIQQIFIDTYDTSKKYYVKKFEVVKEGNLTIDVDYVIFHHLLELLSSREVTGNTAVLMVQNTIEDFVKEDQDILIKILKRNLKIGVSSENFNSIIGVENSIKKFSVALANKLKDVKNVNIFDGNWWVSRKLDGCRCIAIYDGIDVKFYSRQGKEFKTLDNLKLDIKLLFKDDKITVPYVLDGEIELHFNAQQFKLDKGEILMFKRDEEHKVFAKKDSKFLIFCV
jgi:ATP-dependent DNA ligase